MNPDIRQLLEPTTAIARDAGAAILEVYHSDDFAISQKKDDSPLTRADLAAHRVIRDGLLALTPDVPVLSEEDATIPFAKRRLWSHYWLVDPLDGTREFIKRNDEFTVNIALVVDHAPIFGVVYVPVSGNCYRGAHGFAEKLERDGTSIVLHCATVTTDRPTRVAGSRSHGNPSLQAHLQHLGEFTLLPLGSSLKFCRIAEGAADIYPRLGLTSEWDTAAAHAVLRAAGGEVLTFDGQPLRYNTKDSLLNPEFIAVGDPSGNWIERLGLSA